MSRISLGAAARRDLVDITYRFLREGSPASSRRFRLRAESTFGRLAKSPSLGTIYPTGNAELAGLRYIPLPSPFRKYIVFYRGMTGGIEILRVLHGARDIDATLEGTFAPDVGDLDEAGEE